MMKMYVWSMKPRWMAVAYAHSVAEARALLLGSYDNIGDSGDGSCPVRDRAREYVTTVMPSQWIGPNAEFALTDSAELEESDNYARGLQKRINELEAENAALKEMVARPGQE